MTWGVTNAEKPDQEKPVNNVSGTVPVFTNTTKVAQPQSSSAIHYSKDKAYMAGICQVIGGLLCILFGFLQCYSLYRMHLLGKVLCGYGEFAGILFLATGAVSINASKIKTQKRIAASLILSILCIILSAALWVWLIYFGATKFSYFKNREYLRRHHHRHHRHHKSSSESHERNGRSIFSQEGGSLVSTLFICASVFLFLLMLAMFAAAILQTVVCYKALEKKNKYHQEVDSEETIIVPFKTKEKMLADVDDLPKVQRDNFYV